MKIKHVTKNASVIIKKFDLIILASYENGLNSCLRKKTIFKWRDERFNYFFK